MNTLTDNMETLLTELKDALNSHSFRYEDSCCVLYLIEYHTVEYMFKAVREKLEEDKLNYRTNYFELYNIQSAITDLLLCEKQIAKHRQYSKTVYSHVVSAYDINNNLNKLINAYK